MENLINRKPWLLIVAAFVLLIAAWSVLIFLAVKNAPATIPMNQGGAGTRNGTGIPPAKLPAESRTHA